MVELEGMGHLRGEAQAAAKLGQDPVEEHCPSWALCPTGDEEDK